MWADTPQPLRALRMAQSTISMIAIAIIIVTTVADVALRYSVGRPIRGSYDAVECLMVLFVFHGLAAVFIDRAHIVIDLVDHLVTRRMQRGLVMFGDVAGVLALGLMAWAMVDPAMQAYAYGDRKLELGIKLWVVWVFALSGIAGAILCAIGVTFTRPKHG